MVDILGFASTVVAGFSWIPFLTAFAETRPSKWKGGFLLVFTISNALAAGWWIYG